MWEKIYGVVSHESYSMMLISDFYFVILHYLILLKWVLSSVFGKQLSDDLQSS